MVKRESFFIFGFFFCCKATKMKLHNVVSAMPVLSAIFMSVLANQLVTDDSQNTVHLL